MFSVLFLTACEINSNDVDEGVSIGEILVDINQPALTSEYCENLDNTNYNEQTLSSKDNITERDKCLISVAREEGNAQYCWSLSTPFGQSLCITAIQ